MSTGTISLTPEVDIRRAEDRFASSFGWLDSKHSFSFGHHRDPRNTHHGLLLVNNDDVVDAGDRLRDPPAPGHGDRHLGAARLAGPPGLRRATPASSIPGLAQRMSAGTGILHSEKNDSWRLTGDAARRPGALRADVGPARRGAASRPATSSSRSTTSCSRGGAGARRLRAWPSTPAHAAIRISNRVRRAARRPAAARAVSVELPDAPYLHLFVAAGDVDARGCRPLLEPATPSASPPPAASGSPRPTAPRSWSGRCTPASPPDTARPARPTHQETAMTDQTTAAPETAGRDLEALAARRTELREAYLRPARRAAGVDGPRAAPHRADQQRRRDDDPLLPGRPRLPADRADREPRLPGLVALLLRHRQRQPAGVLRLPRPRRRPLRRGARRPAPLRHLGRAVALAATRRPARRGGRRARGAQRRLGLLPRPRRRPHRAHRRPARRDVRRRTSSDRPLPARPPRPTIPGDHTPDEHAPDEYAPDEHPTCCYFLRAQKVATSGVLAVLAPSREVDSREAGAQSRPKTSRV